ncbi:MAG: amidohydrolase family protein [Vicingaceae bacterium]
MSVTPWSPRITLLFVLFWGFTFSLQAQIPTPAEQQSKSILLLGATAHLGNGEVIKRSAIGFDKGKLKDVMAAIDIRLDTTQYDTIIHLPSKHIYPGFIAPNSRLGLVEVDAVRASRDFDDVGEFNPHVRALSAYNTESRITPTIRSNGVLLAQVAPKGGRISGTSSVVQLDAWNWEDAVVRKDDGIHLNWPRLNSIRYAQDAEKRKKAEEKYRDELEELKSFFLKAQAYSKSIFKVEQNLRYEAMRSLFKKEAKLYVHATQVKQISDALFFTDQFNLDVVLVGAYDAWLLADLIKDRNIPILLRRVHSLPYYQDDDINTPYRLAAILHKKGILVGLENSGGMEAMGTRNLPFYAGTAAAYGVSKEEALAMISLNTAKILGIEKQVGSIEVGKDATLFVSEGDALDMMTNQLTHAFIQGRSISLDNPQKQLYRKYSKKYQAD